MSKGNNLFHKGILLSLFWISQVVVHPIQANEIRPNPDLTQGGKPDLTQTEWTLGATGAYGWTWGIPHESTHGAKQIYITKVESGSPASKALKKGDVILGIISPHPGERKKKSKKTSKESIAAPTLFQTDARRELAAAITLAEESKQRGKLVLNVWNKGKTRKATLKLKVMGSYAETYPYRCKKTKNLILMACKALEKNGLGHGIPANINALGLLATGKKSYMSLIKPHAKKIAAQGKNLKFSPGLQTWHYAYNNLFLTEYYLATRDKSVLPAIKEYSKMIAEGQSLAGTYGHDFAYPIYKKGKVIHTPIGGYGAMNQAALPAILSLVLAQKCGVKSKEIKKALENAASFFSYYVDKGAIPYGAHLPYLGSHDNNGKTSIAAIFFDLYGEEDAATFFTKMVLASTHGREHGHTGNYWSFLWGPLAAARAGDKAASAFMNHMQWYYELERSRRGDYTYQSKPAIDKEKHSENQYKGWDCTGARLLHYCLPLKKIYITGKGRKKVKKMVASQLEEALDAGKEPLVTVEPVYDAMDTEELLECLGSWSPLVRHRAAKALSKKPDNVVSELIKKLKGTDPYAQYGACEALRYAGRQSNKAVEALMEQALTTDDMTLVYYAVFAFSSWNGEMGLQAAGQKVIPELLKLAGKNHPKDPRMMIQNNLCLALFGARSIPGFPQDWNPVLKNIHAIDRAVLIPAIKLLLKSENGFNRSCVGFVYDQLTLNELEPLWDAIYQASYEPAPSGAMFANVIRLKGMELMTKHRVKEGMDLIVYYARTQPQWGSEQRMEEVLALLDQYGVHAKRVLPQLEKLLKFAKTEKHFPDGAKDIKVRHIENAIRRVKRSQSEPALISIKSHLKS